ncbi:MAG: molybdopterin-dependent oxidoreductase [Cyanobacteria bacterium P01_A01_bin.40]
MQPKKEIKERKIPTFFYEYKNAEPPPINLETYRLKIRGTVANPLVLSLKELKEKFTRIKVSRRFYCVNGWSVEKLWGGYSLAEVLDFVEPHPDAPYIHAVSLGGYEDTSLISELLEGDAMLVTHMDEEPLSLKRGSPLRLMRFNTYQFKAIKRLDYLEITSHHRPGTWQKVGYDDATIQPYPHFAVDKGEEMLPEQEHLDRFERKMQHSLMFQSSEDDSPESPDSGGSK